MSNEEANQGQRRGANGTRFEEGTLRYDLRASKDFDSFHFIASFVSEELTDDNLCVCLQLTN